MIFEKYTNYNFMWHRYYLTIAGLKALTNIDLDSRLTNITPTDWLMRVSDTLYDWLPANKRYFEFMVATNEEAHNIFLKALTYQAQWALNNGFVDEESGINWDSTMKMADTLYGRTISPRARNLLLNSGLIYCGRIPYIPAYADWEEEPNLTATEESMFEE